MNTKSHTIWAEKYRPVDLTTYIGNQHLKDKIKIYLESGDLPHLLLYGPAGTGKCLAYDENIDIEIEMSDEEFQQLSQYLDDK